MKLALLTSLFLIASVTQAHESTDVLRVHSGGEFAVETAWTSRTGFQKNTTRFVTSMSYGLCAAPVKHTTQCQLQKVECCVPGVLCRDHYRVKTSCVYQCKTTSFFKACGPSKGIVRVNVKQGFRLRPVASSSANILITEAVDGAPAPTQVTEEPAPEPSILEPTPADQE